MAAGLKLKTGLRSGISTSLRQAIELLSLNQVELQEKISQALQENPFLNEKEPYSRPLAAAAETSGKGEFLEELAAGPQQSLAENLLMQLHFLAIPPALLPLARLLVSDTDERGFVRQGHEQLALQAGYSRHQLRQVLPWLKKLEPTGVCAENSWQSLEWQAGSKYPHDAILPDLIALLQQGQTAQNSRSIPETCALIARELMLPAQLIEQKMQLLATLDPFPARSERTEVLHVTVDVIFETRQEQTQVMVNHELLPDLSVDRSLFEQLLAAGGDASWEKKFHEAEKLLQSIRYRQSSLEKVAVAIRQKQSDFFRFGPRALQPLNLADVARLTGLHVSTVSRLVAGKYCQCRWGVFSLKIFFPAGFKSGEGKSSVELLKENLLALISRENKAEPLSDHDLADNLQNCGFEIKRRTVAKYRHLLGIAPASERKI